jgi:hypothetical protein
MLGIVQMGFKKPWKKPMGFVPAVSCPLGLSTSQRALVSIVVLTIGDDDENAQLQRRTAQ